MILAAFTRIVWPDGFGSDRLLFCGGLSWVLRWFMLRRECPVRERLRKRLLGSLVYPLECRACVAWQAEVLRMEGLALRGSGGLEEFLGERLRERLRSTGVTPGQVEGLCSR